MTIKTTTTANNTNPNFIHLEMQYNIYTHIHRYSCWAANRAASTSKNNRFTVETGQKILENAAIRNLILNPDGLPGNEVEFDNQHKIWREEIIGFSEKIANEKFAHGIAAKMINIYLKSIIICGGFHEHPNSKFIHPPIDSILLKELYEKNFNNKSDFWLNAQKIAWSNFDSNDYQNVINEIRIGLKGDPLWSIEKYWKGHR